MGLHGMGLQGMGLQGLQQEPHQEQSAHTRKLQQYKTQLQMLHHQARRP